MSDQNGTPMEDVLYGANYTTRSEYHIERIQVSDEGTYECSEGNETLAIVRVEIEGKPNLEYLSRGTMEGIT